MKYLQYLLVASILLSIESKAQNSDINGVFCTDVKSDADGNVYVCGYFQGFVSFGRTMLKSNKGSTDIFLAKFSKEGGNIWAVKAGSESTDVATGLVIDDKGYVYVTGYFQSTADFEYRKIKSRGLSDIFIARYNPSGGINMLKYFGGRGSDEPIGIGIDAQGDIYFAGTFTERFSIVDKSINLNGTSSIFITKLSANGSPNWSKVVGDQDGIILLNDLDVDKSGNVFICGSFSHTLLIGETQTASQGDLDAFALKLTSEGGIAYSKFYASPVTDLARAICANNKGSAIMAGHAVTGMTKSSGFIYELDAEGNKGTSNNWDLGFETKIQDLAINSDGELMMCGSFSEHEQFDDVGVNCYGVDGFVIKCNPLFKASWGFESNGKLSGLAECMYVDAAGNTIIGLNRPRVEGSQEEAVYIAKIDKTAKLLWSSEVGAAEKSELYDPTARYVDFKGKLLMGSEFLVPVVESAVELKDGSGNIVETTQTDDYGDFVFHNLNVKNEYSINAKEAIDQSKEMPVFVANQFGKIMGEIDKKGEGKFDYKILPAALVEIAEMEEMDTKLSVDKFLKGGEKEIAIDLQIYYEPGEFEVPSAYLSDLTTLARRLKAQSGLAIEIASYTDAIGDNAQNQELSQKRADEIVAYLQKRGIPSSMITGKGYGESGIINRCTDGVENCSDQEHQANRRTEIRMNRKK